MTKPAKQSALFEKASIDAKMGLSGKTRLKRGMKNERVLSIQNRIFVDLGAGGRCAAGSRRGATQQRKVGGGGAQAGSRTSGTGGRASRARDGASGTRGRPRRATWCSLRARKSAGAQFRWTPLSRPPRLG